MSTIYDIAKAAGVSPATVSKVFNDYSEVSVKTKERVLAIAKEMGYVPNLTAQSLKTNKSFLVGIMFTEDLGIGLEHQFFSVILESFRKVIGRYGYDTVFINKTLGKNEIGYLEHCKYRNVDGLFIITALQDDIDTEKLKASNIKVVTTDIVYENTPYVTSDNYNGGRMAIKYLHDMGHRRIAHISGPFNTMAALERHLGVVKGMEDVGIEKDDAYFIEAEVFDYESAFKSTQYLLSRFNENNRPTAIFVGADIMAIAAMKAIRSRGLKVPEDISIIGFDDIEAAKYVSPELTTVRQNKEKIGEQLAKTLVKLMNNEEVPMELPRIPVSIVERSSVIKI